MATIAENLQRIETAKSDIRTAIINKGVDVPSGDTIDTYASKIDSISTGSGLKLKDVQSATYTSNGSYSILPDDGYDGMAKVNVEVNVPQKEEQGKTLTITSNGTTTVEPDEGKSLSAVTITTDVKNDIKISNASITNTFSNSHYFLQMTDTYTDYTYSGETIPINFFNSCSKLTGFTWNVPTGSLGKVEQNAFFNSGLKTFNFPSKMAWIDNLAFSYSKLEGNITLTINKIGTQSFSDCTGLTSIDITTISIGEYAFINCTGLTSITVRGSSVEGSTTFTTISSNTFDNTNNCPIYVPSDKVEDLKTASGWSAYADRLQPIAE